MTRSDVYAGVSGWQQQDIDAHIEFMKSVTSSLRQSGELLSTEGLEVPAHAVVVRARKNGEPVTDGLFPESKEFLAGYWIRRGRRCGACLSNRRARLERARTWRRAAQHAHRGATHCAPRHRKRAEFDVTKPGRRSEPKS